MAFVMRRIFDGKPGSGNELIEICNDGNFIVRALGIAIKPRVLSDFNSGRTDRVVMEWEAESISELMVFGEEGGARTRFTRRSSLQCSASWPG